MSAIEYEPRRPCSEIDHAWDWQDCDTRGDYYKCDFCPAWGFTSYDDFTNQPQEVKP